MVFKDVNHEEAGAEPASVISPQASAPPLETRLAAPIDRLAATVADFILFSPIAALAMAPFKRQVVEAQLAANDEAAMLAYLSAGLTAALILVIYQTLCLMKWRATPGKIIFGLRVENVWPGQKVLNPMSAFLRSVVFCLECLMCGLPWLAILSNERRRPFHDRIADTVVISKRARKVGPPAMSEMAFSSGLLAAVLTCVALVSTLKLTQMGLGGAKLTADLEASGDLCSSVGSAEQTWVPGNGEAMPTRVGVALSLYQAQAIDEDCLKLEADYAMWNGDEKDLAYLARGLAEKTDDELAQSYLDKACETSALGDACKALTLLREPDLPEDDVEAKTARVERENEVHDLVASLSAKNAPFLKLLAIRELSTERNDAGALALIDAFPPQKELGYFLATERTKALWNLNRQNEARLALKSSISGFDPEQRVALSRWFCQNETSAIGCASDSRPACDWLANAVDRDADLLKKGDIALTYLRGESCSARLGEKQLASIKTKVTDETAKTYVEALELLAKGDKDKGREVLEKIVVSSEKAGAFFAEANARLVDIASSSKELLKVRQAWIDLDPNEEGWVYLGHHLMDRYNELKAWDQTLEVGFKLGENQAIDRGAARALVVAAYRAGHSRMAYGYLEAFAKTTRSAVTADERPRERLPANASGSASGGSVDGFDEIARDLLNGASLGPSTRPNRVPK